MLIALPRPSSVQLRVGRDLPRLRPIVVEAAHDERGGVADPQVTMTNNMSARRTGTPLVVLASKSPVPSERAFCA